jgi:hypothetical protein
MGKPSNGLLVYQTGERSETRAFNFYGNAAFVLTLSSQFSEPRWLQFVHGPEEPTIWPEPMESELRELGVHKNE